MDWINSNVSYEYDDDDEYERWINAKYNLKQLSIIPCDDEYKDYIHLDDGTVTFLDMKDYFRLSHGGY